MKEKNPPKIRGIFLGAEDRARTGHPDLGKVVLYQMSYFRLYKNYFEDCKNNKTALLNKFFFLLVLGLIL